MYVILIEYDAPLVRVDEALPAHAAWLERQYDAGRFLASGRQEPRVGGVILAAEGPRAELEAIIAGDPFAELGLARHTIVEFHPSRVAPSAFQTWR